MNITAQPVAYDIATAVAVSGIGRTRLYAYIKAKRLKARKAGRRTVILAADLEAFLDSLPEMEADLSGMAFNAKPPRFATSAARESVQLGSSNALSNTSSPLELQVAWITTRFCVSPDLALTLAFFSDGAFSRLVQRGPLIGGARVTSFDDIALVGGWQTLASTRGMLARDRFSLNQASGPFALSGRAVFGGVGMSDPVLDAALDYAAAGFPVLPIRLNKVGKKMPLLKEWQRVATTDPDVIHKWWDEDFRGSGVAVLTGVRTRLLTVEVDIKTVNGMNAFKALGLTWLDCVPTTVTQSGGNHFHYRTPPGLVLKNTASVIGPGIDTRGEGGCIVMPPSRLDPKRARPNASMTGAV